MKLIPIKANMTELELDKPVVTYAHGPVKVLFSYQTPVAYYDGFEYYRTSKRWSNTTTRHINEWLKGLPAKQMPQEELNKIGSSIEAK